MSDRAAWALFVASSATAFGIAIADIASGGGW